MITVLVDLVGAGSPKDVRIVVTGLAPGDRYAITGSGGGVSWPVRGGSGVSTGSVLILGDNRTPLNAPLTYTVTVGAVSVTSDPIVVAHARTAVLQSLDARTSVDFAWLDTGAPREYAPSHSIHQVAGRRRPVVRYDVTGDGGGTHEISTWGQATIDLGALLSTGRPVVIRTDGQVVDLDPVAVLVLTRVSSVRVGAQEEYGDTRRWSLAYLLIDDPDPDAVILLSTWDDFDAVNTGLTWGDFDAQWAGSTWDAFDLFDWEGQA